VQGADQTSHMKGRGVSVGIDLRTQLIYEEEQLEDA